MNKPRASKGSKAVFWAELVAGKYSARMKKRWKSECTGQSSARKEGRPGVPRRLLLELRIFSVGRGKIDYTRSFI
jgi:hypothetical protein